MNEQEELVMRLRFENLIWIVYIGVAIFNIYGDELIKRAIQDNDKFASKRQKNIFSCSNYYHYNLFLLLSKEL